MKGKGRLESVLQMRRLCPSEEAFFAQGHPRADWRSDFPIPTGSVLGGFTTWPSSEIVSNKAANQPPTPTHPHSPPHAPTLTTHPPPTLALGS